MPLTCTCTPNDLIQQSSINPYMYSTILGTSQAQLKGKAYMDESGCWITIISLFYRRSFLSIHLNGEIVGAYKLLYRMLNGVAAALATIEVHIRVYHQHHVFSSFFSFSHCFILYYYVVHSTLDSYCNMATDEDGIEKNHRNEIYNKRLLRRFWMKLHTISPT